MCNALELKPSAYYNWTKRQIERNEKKKIEVKLANRVQEVFDINRKVYGYRKMQLALGKEGLSLSLYNSENNA